MRYLLTAIILCSCTPNNTHNKLFVSDKDLGKDYELECGRFTSWTSFASKRTPGGSLFLAPFDGCIARKKK